MISGYIMVDLEKMDVTGVDKVTPQNIPGIFNKLTTAFNTGKPIVAHNFNYGYNETDKVWNDSAPTTMAIFKTKDDNDKDAFMWLFNIYSITINEDNDIVVVSVIPEQDGDDTEQGSES